MDMKMNKREAIKLLEKTIIDIQQEFTTTPYKFLSEDDFKCHIYAQILRGLGEKFSVHTETSFRDGDGKLSKKPDLSIYVKKGIKTHNEKFSWEVFSDDVLAIIEIKFFKGNSKKNDSSAMNDIDKLESLMKINPKARAFFAVFSFPELDMTHIEKRCKDLNIRFHYCSGIKK